MLSPFGRSSVSYARSSFSTNTQSSHRSHGFDEDVLEPNGIFTAITKPNEDSWSRIALSLGMPSKTDYQISNNVSRLCQRLRRRRVMSSPQIADAFAALLEPIIAPLNFTQSSFTEYKDAAVPTRDTLRNSIYRLPIPKPAISIGFSQRHFSHLDDDLQNGIISTPQGDPADLGHISQPVPGQYWPFFTVDISEESLVTAQHAASVTGSTCNNATSLLASAVASPYGTKHALGAGIDRNFCISFSLGIFNKIAALNVHELCDGASFLTTTVQTFRLDDEQETAILVSRLNSIMIWAKFGRLPLLVEKLELLDRKVNGAAALSNSRSYRDEFDPAIFRTLDLRTKKPGRLRTALESKATKMPIFLRANAAIAG